MTEQNLAIEIIKLNFPKTHKMIRGNLVGGFDDTDCDFGKTLLLSISALKEIQQYRALGTVEELQKAKEKQMPKKPTNEFHKKYTRHMGDCPNCKCGISSRKIYCSNCGQAIDWSEYGTDD